MNGSCLMSEKKKEKSFRFLTPVEKIPPGPGRSTIYGNILREFLGSGLKYAEVIDIGKKPVTIVIMLKKKMKESGIRNVTVKIRNKKVYLEKIE